MKLNRKNLFLASSAVITVTFSAPDAHAANGTWNVDASGNWSLNTNWSSTPTVPGTTAGDVIGLTNNITANSTVTIDTTSRTAGILTLGDSDDSHAFTLNASGGATLTLNNSGGGTQINETGTLVDAIFAPLILSGNLAVNTAGSLQILGDISGNGTLTKLGGNDTVLTLSGNNSYSGGTFLSGGQIIASNANALGSGNVTINGGRRLLIDAGANVTNNITHSSANGELGRGVLESSGNGTATLSGNLTITGGIGSGGYFASTSGNDLVLSGIITASVGISQRLGTVTYSGGGTGYGNLSITGTAKVGAENGIATTGNLTIGGSGTAFLDLNGFNQTLVGITKGGSAATIGTSSTTANSTLTTTGTSTYAGTIVDVIPLSGGNKTLALTVASGSLTLSGANTYTGATTISTGTLSLANETPLGTVPGTDGTNAISMAADTVLQSATGGANTSTGTGVSTNVFAPIALAAGGNTTLRIGTGAANTTHTFNINGAIGGTTGNVVFTTTTNSFSNGGSVFVLGASGNYTGNTTITTGNGSNNPVFVRNAVVNALPTTTVLTFDQVPGGGTGRTFQYDLNGNDQTLAGLSNGGVVPNVRRMQVTSTANATLTINNTADFTFGGASNVGGLTEAQIRGAISLTKSGTGTFTLGGTLANTTAQGNTHTGDTKILGGTLVLGEFNSLQNSTFDTGASIAGNSTAGLKTTVTALTLGGLSGNKNFADVFTTALGGPTNTTPRGGYDGLAALTLNLGTGVTKSYSGNIGNGAGNMTLTKTGNGTQILSGTNTYTGGTTLATGTLQFKNTASMPAGGAVAVGNSTTLVVNVGGPGEWTTGTSGNGTIGGLLAGLGGQGGTVTYATGNLTLGFDTSNASPTTQTFAGGIPNIGTSLVITKLGNNTLALSGLSATAASNYSGATIINQGTLAITTTSPSLTGNLTFGATPANTTPGILDLTNASATFAGALSLNTESATPSEIKIGTGRSLTINGAVQIGASTPVVSGSEAKLAMTGAGEFIHNGTTLLVGGMTSSQQFSTLDLSGLAKATITTSGNFRIAPNTGTNTGGQATMLLPAPAVADTVLTANITSNGSNGISVGNGGALFNKTPDFMNTLQLGTGLTKLNAALINVGGNQVTGTLRDVGQIIFGQAAGDLIIRAADGGNTSRATAVNVGVSTSTTAAGSQTLPILFDVSGHDADILVTSINVGQAARVGNQGFEFNFGVGDNSLTGGFSSKLDATNVNIGIRTGGTNTAANTLTSKVNLSGGTVVFGNGTGTGVDIGNNQLGNATTTGASSTVAELNIGNGTVTINNGASGFAVRIGSNVADGNGTVTASMNLTGGITTLGGDIIRGATSPRTTSTLKISGGTLNMGGNDIGTATEIITLTAESGTLQNVATINGSGGLTKTTAGNLTLSGNNSYTGNTIVSDGTLALGSSTALPNSSPVSIANATLNAATAGIEDAGTLDVTGNATLNLASGAQIEFDNSNGSWAGNLTITGPFVSGLSLRFGTTSAGLDPTNQLSKISAAGFTGFALNSSGYLTATATGTPYSAWATLKGLTGANNAKTDDPDKDGKNNLQEFALDGNPLSGANDGKVVGKVATLGADRVLTLTLPVRALASFGNDGGDQLAGPIDGIYYRIEGGTNLVTFTDTITEVTDGNQTAIQAGLPALSATPAPGWTYRTFRVSGTVPAVPKNFMRAKISETNP